MVNSKTAMFEASAKSITSCSRPSTFSVICMAMSSVNSWRCVSGRALMGSGSASASVGAGGASSLLETLALHPPPSPLLAVAPVILCRRCSRWRRLGLAGSQQQKKQTQCENGYYTHGKLSSIH
jgi:hypothetical protein